MAFLFIFGEILDTLISETRLMKKIFTTLLFLFVSYFLNAQSSNCTIPVRIGDNENNNNYYNSNQLVQICKGSVIKLYSYEEFNATYQWQKNNINIPNATKSFIEVSEEGTYTVIAKNTFCIYNSPKINLDLTSVIASYSLVKDAVPIIYNTSYKMCNNGAILGVNDFMNTFSPSLYQWQRNGIDIGDGSSIIVAESGIYSVRIKNGNCQLNTPPFKLDVTTEKIIEPLKYGTNINLPDTINICQGTSTIISNVGQGTPQTKWFKDSKLFTTTTIYNHNVVISEAGNYFTQYNTLMGCEVNSKPVKINISNKLLAPKLSYKSETAFGCYGDQITVDDLSYAQYTSLTSRNPYLTWFYNDRIVDLRGFNKNLFAEKNDKGKFKVEYNIGNCKVQSKDFNNTLGLNGSNTIKLSGYKKGDKICPQNKVKLIFDYAILNPVIKWYKDNQEVLITSDYINRLEISESGKYHAVIISNNNQCIEFTDTVEVVIPKIFPSQIIQEVVNCANKLSVQETEGIIYAWKKDGKLLPNINTNEFIPKESGIYSLVSNQEYCSYESNKVAFLAKLSPNQSICEGDTLKLTSSLATSYKWTGPNSFTSNQQNPKIPNVSAKNNGLYILSTIRNTCSSIDSLTVKVNAKPSISLDRAANYCLGKTLSMFATSNNTNTFFVWTIPNNFSSYSGNTLSLNSVSKSYNGIYNITATDYNSRCANTITTQITLVENNCSSIEFDNPPKSLCANAQNSLAFKLTGNFPNDETFDLYYVDYNGKKTKIATTTKSPIVFKNSYYDRLVIESSKQKIRSNIIIVSTENPYFYISFNQLKVCDGYSVPLKIDSNYYKFDKIQWLLNGKEISNATNYAHDANKTGIYTAKAEKNGCTAVYVEHTDYLEPGLKITIGEITPPYIGITNTPLVCDGFTVGFKSDTLYLKDVKYQWQIDGVDIPKATDKALAASKTGNYSLKITQGKCEAVSDKRKVFIGELKSPDIYSSPFYRKNDVIEICSGIELTLQTSDYAIYKNSKILPIDGTNFQWQKNGVDIPKATDVSLKTKEEGIYRLKVSQGDCAAFSKNITVKKGNSKLMYLRHPAKACEGDSLSIYSSGNGESIFNLTKQVKLYKNDKYIKDIEYQSSYYIKETGKYYTTATFNVPESKETCTVFSDTIDLEIKGKIVPYKLPDYYSSSCVDSLQIYSQYNNQNAKHQWKFNGNVLPKDTINYLIVKKNGTYQVETKNESGCTYTSEPLVIEFGKLNVEISSQNSIYCLKNENYIYPYIKGTYNYNLLSYEWLLDGVKIGKNANQQILKSGTYNLTVKQGTCTGTASTKIELVDIPKSISKDSLFFCPNGSVVIEAPKMDKYTWLLNSLLQITKHKA